MRKDVLIQVFLKRDIVFKTKPQLAVEMIKEPKEEHFAYGWLCADLLYGRNFYFRESLDEMGIKCVVDIQKYHLKYIEVSHLFIPQQSKRKNSKNTHYQTDTSLTTSDKYIQSISENDWRIIEYRQGTKGMMKARYHMKEVNIWSLGSEKSQKRTLIIRNINNKYSLRNFSLEATTEKAMTYMQGQPYLVEKTINDQKGELGLFDYQIRKYVFRYLHMALVMISMNYVLGMINKNRDKILQLSVRDIKLQLIEILLKNCVQIDKEITQMISRHKQRAVDIVFNYQEYRNST